MARRPRRNHLPLFNAKVAVAVLKGEETIVELTQRFSLGRGWHERFLFFPWFAGQFIKSMTLNQGTDYDKKEKLIGQTHSLQIKSQAVELAKAIGVKETAQKFGIENAQTLGAWVRHEGRLLRIALFKTLRDLRPKTNA